MVVGIAVLGATGGASKARTWCGARDSAGLGGLVQEGSNPHRLDGKKYSNFGNSPVNYKMKMI